MELILPHLAKDVIVLNKTASVAVVSCWTEPQKILKDIPPETQNNICAIGTLYGGGFSNLIRNLAYNPQITDVFILGRDRSGSGQDLVNFFNNGVQRVDYLGTIKNQIINSDRFVDDDIDRRKFLFPPAIHYYGKLMQVDTVSNACKEINEHIPIKSDLTRLSWPLPPKQEVTTYPSNTDEHQIIADSPYEAYSLMLNRIVQFGDRVSLAKGDRIELQGLKVVIRDPADFTQFNEIGFSPERFNEYYETNFKETQKAEMSYTYGERLNAGGDFITSAVEQLKADSQSRKAFRCTWQIVDNAGDHPPCLISVFLRANKKKLNLYTTFRAHNAVDAWPLNLYALSRILTEISTAVNMPMGTITVFSQSISVDPKDLDRAKLVAAKSRKYKFKEDPMGNFVISISDDEIVACWQYNEQTIKEFHGKTAQDIHYQIIADDIPLTNSHALYLGRMLERAESCKERNVPFEQI